MCSSDKIDLIFQDTDWNSDDDFVCERNGKVSLNQKITPTTYANLTTKGKKTVGVKTKTSTRNYFNDTSESSLSKQNVSLNDQTNTLIVDIKDATNTKNTNILKKSSSEKRMSSEIDISIIHFLDHVTRGIKFNRNLKQSVKSPLVRNLKGLKPHKVIYPFSRRVTAIAWHPKNPSIVAAGSKGGEIILWNTEASGDDLFIPGVGPGGSVCALKFHQEKPTFVYTASLTGKVMLQDFFRKNNNILLETHSFDNWFCSLDVLLQQKLLMAGDCNGYAYLSDPDGNMLWSAKKKLHKNKISHIEFCPASHHLVVTASIDHYMKLWDIRMLKDSSSALHTFLHDKGVNSAYFSLLNGASLLTTDQHSQLRVYKSPLWNLQCVIPHPHRQFQHLTPIKACWHPLEDIVVVGRYPDDNFYPGERRSVDYFDGQSGNLLYQMWDPDMTGIVSLNQFNPPGDVLASGMGFHLFVWRTATEDEKSMEKLLNSFSSNLNHSGNQFTRRKGNRRPKKNEQEIFEYNFDVNNVITVDYTRNY